VAGQAGIDVGAGGRGIRKRRFPQIPRSTPGAFLMAALQGSASRPADEAPVGDLGALGRYFRYDFVSGLLVFLIALPLCLGISLASGYPPIAGIFTAILGAIITPFISNSELTIKGPAAGLIVIVLGCVEQFGGDGMTGGWSAADADAYRAALAVGVAAAVLQIAFGFVRAGILGEFFPVSAVHGMLAAIGVIIISKQIPVALGVQAKGEPLELLKEIPHFIAEANPAIAAIGGASLLIMFLWPLVRNRWSWCKPIPAPLIVIAVSVTMGMAFDLLHEHSYVLQGHKYQLGEQYLVSMPDRAFGMFDEITTPNFAVLRTLGAWKWVLMFFIIGSLESLLSAKAVDLLDPWKRKTNMDRDMIAVGTANLAASLVGGLPMISEIVRSRANIDNGARTRFADFWHGVFLLACVALIPMALHRIPLAALAAMLIYTGYRLAHPSEFIHALHIGREQLVVFASTLVAVLATDLLIGIAIGIGVKLVIHVANGVPIKSLLKPYLDIEERGDGTCVISAHQSAVFTNWIPFRREIEHLGLVQRRNVVVDLSNTRLVDHSVMDKLAEMQRDFAREGLQLDVVGLDAHVQLSQHELATRKQGLARLRHLTVVAPQAMEQELCERLGREGVSAYTLEACRGRLGLSDDPSAAPVPLVRFETVVPGNVCDRVIDCLRREFLPKRQLAAFVEPIDVLRDYQAVVSSGAGVRDELASSPVVAGR
jgi:MFS superfamily sulfate permease-like transporter